MLILFISFCLFALILPNSAFAITPAAPYYNDIMPKGDHTPPLENANQTGSGNYVKNANDQRVHGEYKSNTNSCGSCHQTHTATGDQLLFKNGTYATCVSCHDGTLGIYNVFDPSTAGTFGGTAEGNMSVHMANDSIMHKAAPGGNPDGTNQWEDSFSCGSCHSPHGSYSDRLLQYNPNGVGDRPPAEGGIKANFVKVIDYENKSVEAQTPGASDFIAVRGTKIEHGIIDSNITDSDIVIAIYELNNDKTDYVKTSNPWLYGQAFGTTDQRNSKVKFIIQQDFSFLNPNGTYAETDKDKVIDDADQNVIFNLQNGYAYESASANMLNQALLADISRATVVDLDLVPTGEKSPSGVDITQNHVETLWTTTSGMGVAMSEFCISCHTDYYGEPGKEPIYNDGIHPHNTSSDSLTCARCHYAHGTDVTVMMDAQGNTLEDLTVTMGSEEAARSYLLDGNESSRIKRYTNMTVCMVCHNVGI